MSAKFRIAAEVHNVREVSQLGSADLGYWQDRLAKVDLQPVVENGRARLLLISAEMRYLGVRFRELSINALVTADNPLGQPGAFLTQAFNSFRPFAWSERTLFDTPYAHGDVRVGTAASPAIELHMRGEEVFSARQGASPGDRSPPVKDLWQGPVFLPIVDGRDARDGKLFYAIVLGLTRTYAFDPAADHFFLHPTAMLPGVQALRESGYLPEQWIARVQAGHVKSVTYRRSNPPALPLGA